MSSFNYMDNVPVKISENYKRPPRIYQLPQAIANRLALPPKHYEENDKFRYDFQLEKKVLMRIPEWRRLRHQEREARRERKERREEMRLRELEARQRELLGAVSYPSAEDLSSSSSSDGEDDSDEKRKELTLGVSQLPAPTTSASEPPMQSNFYDILQPTILNLSNGESFNHKHHNGILGDSSLANGGGVGVGVGVDTGPIKTTFSAFNYKDFEEDTSSPFDNIELKTINDLDILAQVLHSTQLKERAEKAALEQEERQAEPEEQSVENEQTKETQKTLGNGVTTTVLHPEEASKEREPAKENVTATRGHIPKFEPYVQASTALYHNSLNYNASTMLPVNMYQLNHTYMHSQEPQVYNMLYSGSNAMSNVPAGFLNSSQQNAAQHHNCPAIYGSPSVYNEASTTTTSTTNTASAFFSPAQHGSSTVLPYFPNSSPYMLPLNSQQHGPQLMPYAHQQQFMGQMPAMEQQQLQQQEQEQDINLKSKSVPNIVEELRDELLQSEMRRTRNLSYNSSQDKLEDAATETQGGSDSREGLKTPIPTAMSLPKADLHYSKLSPSAKRLAKNISSMGFPLERVSKIAEIYGEDDKKIVEHLIPLSELMDLGFDETKISEALIKFGNNKEKALEYLIT